VIAIAVPRKDAVKPATTVTAPSRKSRGLQALAMMAKAVSSESEGQVSLAQGLEPWMVTGQEMSSEVPPPAARPADAPGAGSSGAPGRPNTGATDPRPGWAGTIEGTA